ncbi:MAG TPA: carboxypeptidase-like regulatory domain-containing protein [Gemmatimonadaceae bacterium]|nr:carboxypeptidase-like regulatory domain-containing protein [Gemmatimonadaceae bacterium]
MKKASLLAVWATCALAVANGCHRDPKLTAWTTGEPNAPPDVAAVYRAVLDEVFPRGSNGPSLIAISQMIEPSVVELDTTLKRRQRIPNGTIAPFSYRIPIAFIDSASLRDLWLQTRMADSIAYTVPMTDIRYRQREAAPFIERYPGAWGRLTLSRVAFGRQLRDAAVEVRYASATPGANYGDEIFRLVRNRNEWKVVKRVPRDEAIKPEPLPQGMLRAWVDSSLLPAPRRRLLRGTVRDSASGRPLSGIVIRIKAAPLGTQGQILWDKGPEEWGTLLTDAAGGYAIFNPPSGFMWIEAECPPTRGLRGGGLAPAALEPGSGLDTVLDFRVRFSACPALARFMAAEAKRHLEDVKRSKVEAAARAVQGNIWGTLRDSRTGRPVPRAWIRVDERGGLGGSDSTGRFWLWGFAPGKHTIIVYCPLRRQWLGKVATTVAIEAPPAMKDTMDIAVDTRGCADVPVDTVRVRTQGVLSEGFEDGFFTPCKPFNQIPLGGYRDFSGQAYLGFAQGGIEPAGGWPDVKPEDGYYKTFMDVEGNLIGPGSYGHLGIATYQLIVTRVFSAKAATKKSCDNENPR